MKPQGWFQKDKSASRRPKALGDAVPPRASDASRFAARLRPHELIAMLTHHYARVRARSLPKVKVSLAVRMPSGKAAVTILTRSAF
jgi:hypothetical protein